ncbi:SGNH/GDSL hydrolase family protein [Streptomyces sp. NPDC047000]|uniref:SGNH/GDSL hydrolase family protein n=1 Tax=Streptomyces sp. NPDC047000 TaxID=3155474 RepID=UPI0033FA7BF3
MSAVASPVAQADTSLRYVALGDSYASGVGAAPYDPASGDCKRSPENYPHPWAAAHPALPLTDVTCSRATVADARGSQLSALNDATRLVTITVGGNDARFTSVATTCLTGSDADCVAATQSASAYAKTQMATDLAALCTDISARAPQALTVVLGYPHAVADTGTCDVVDLGSVKRTAVNGFSDALAEGTKAAVSGKFAYFVDMWDQFSGHGACGSDPWVNGVDLAEPTATFHPNAAGCTLGCTAKLNSIW